MTNGAAIPSIPLINITNGDESNVSVETTSLKKGVLPDEGNVSDLTLVPIETISEMQKAASASEMVTPVHQVKRLAEVNVKRPSLLLGDWKFETKVCIFVATDGTIDRPSENPPGSVSWAQMDSSSDTWIPFVDGSIVPETQKQYAPPAQAYHASRLRRFRQTVFASSAMID